MENAIPRVVRSGDRQPNTHTHGPIYICIHRYIYMESRQVYYKSLYSKGDIYDLRAREFDSKHG